MKRLSFFKPFIGDKYEIGINDKKILVVGASFYCSKTDCPFFADCTDVIKKDSSKYDSLCPDYLNEDTQLSEEPTNSITNEYRTYKVFANFISKYIGSHDYKEVWSHLAFTNYVQFIQPSLTTKKRYLSKRDFDAFIETLSQLKPDIVISWGVAFLDDIRANNPYVIDKDLLEQREYYICHMNGVPNVNHGITLLSCYHPASVSHWYNDLDLFKKYMRMALNDEGDC